MIQPDKIKVGAGVIFLSITGLSRDWGISEVNVLKMMDMMSIPRVVFPGGKKKYVSLYPVEEYMFNMGLPEAYKGDTVFVKAHHELAGCLYGTLTKEVIRERCLALSKGLRRKGLTYGRKAPKITTRKR